MYYHFGFYVFKVKVYWSLRGQLLDISLWLVLIRVVLMMAKLPLFCLLSFVSFSQNKLFLNDFLVFIFSFERDPSANNSQYFQIFTKNIRLNAASYLHYRSVTVNSNTVNSKFHLIRRFCEIFARLLSFHV